jgi:hypothetical protein
VICRVRVKYWEENKCKEAYTNFIYDTEVLNVRGFMDERLGEGIII